MASSEVINEDLGQGEFFFRCEEGQADGAGPGFERLQQPVGTIQRRLDAKAKLRNGF